MRTPWGFYGRQKELGQLAGILERERWFFLKITGRRRIGKTSLVQEALKLHGRGQTLYLQIPDSDPAGVLAAAREFYELFQISEPPPSDLQSLARSIGTLARSGYVVAVDEFQYFLRKVLFDFNSYLQAEVDRLAADASNVRGGLIVLGSIHTELPPAAATLGTFGAAGGEVAPAVGPGAGPGVAALGVVAAAPSDGWSCSPRPVRA